MFELKQYRRVMFDSNEDLLNFEGKLTISFKNDIKNFADFRSRTEK